MLITKKIDDYQNIKEKQGWIEEIQLQKTPETTVAWKFFHQNAT